MTTSNNTQIVISSNPTNLVAALTAYAVYAVVEAEYGSVEVMGSSDELTLNHHVRAERPCPCSLPNEQFDSVRDTVEAIGLSHMDLDTLGGLAAILGRKPENEKFWDCASFVDTNGPHRIKECSSYDQHTHELLASFWAWSQANRLFPPRDGSVMDCSDFVSGALDELEKILGGGEGRIERGREFLKNEEELNKQSFISIRDGVVVREADNFVNHLYGTPSGSIGEAVVALNTKFKSITVSFADTPKGMNAREIVQTLWGDKAGGHAGIAGSPRDREMTKEDLEDCVRLTAQIVEDPTKDPR